MKRRDKRKRLKKRFADSSAKAAVKPDEPDGKGTVRVTRDSCGRQYINAPDGSLRRVDKIDSRKLTWLSGEG